VEAKIKVRKPNALPLLKGSKFHYRVELPGSGESAIEGLNIVLNFKGEAIVNFVLPNSKYSLFSLGLEIYEGYNKEAIIFTYPMAVV